MTFSNKKYLFLLIKYTFSCVMCVVANYVENSMAYYLKAIVHEPHLTTPLACVPFFSLNIIATLISICVYVIFSIDRLFFVCYVFRIFILICRLF